MGANSSQHSRNMMYGPRQICCNGCGPDQARSTVESFVSDESDGPPSTIKFSSRPSTIKFSTRPESVKKSQIVLSVGQDKEVPVATADETAPTVESLPDTASESRLSTISWNKTLANILRYPPMSAQDAVSCYQLWLKVAH